VALERHLNGVVRSFINYRTFFLTPAVSVRPILHTAPIILLLCERNPATYDVRLMAISFDIVKRHSSRVLLVAYHFFFGIVDLSIIMYLPLAHLKEKTYCILLFRRKREKREKESLSKNEDLDGTIPSALDMLECIHCILQWVRVCE
jgi:hypothetical protein